MPGAQESRWRFLITPRWLGWHLFTVVAVIGMLWLGDWQFRRALAGNGLSWAYTFEWPIFAIMGVVFWVKTIRDEIHPPEPAAADQDEVPLPAGAYPAASGSAGDTVPAGGPPPTAEDAELAAYNAYLARLHREVRDHGKWHGMR